mmetsp:Transcript_21470/g.35503  ORF Transcript_21470/g.35503 Transcript_21470/m.35503 type:complete len:777 (+) Transcript_21470:186-2516(+)
MHCDPFFVVHYERHEAPSKHLSYISQCSKMHIRVASFTVKTTETTMKSRNVVRTSVIDQRRKSQISVIEQRIEIISLRFQDPHIEQKYAEWHIRKGWARETVSSILLLSVGAVLLVWLKVVLTNAVFHTILWPLLAVIVAGIAVFGMHAVGIFFIPMRFVAKDALFYMGISLLVLFQFMFIVAIPDPMTCAAGHAIVIGRYTLGARFRFISVLFAILSTTISFIVLYAIHFRQGWPLLGELSIIVYLGTGTFTIIAVRGLEHHHREEFLRATDLEQALFEETAKSTRLQLENDQLKTSQPGADRPMELKTPLDNVLHVLRSLFTDANLEPYVALQLDSVIQTLSTTANVLRPALFANKGSLETLEKSVSDWLMKEVRVLPTSIADIPAAEKSSVANKLFSSETSCEYDSSEMEIVNMQTSKLRFHLPRTASMLVPYTPGMLPVCKDSDHDILQKKLLHVCDWDEFDLAGVHNLTKTGTLSTVAFAAFQKFGLFRKLRIDENKFVCFVTAVQEAYDDKNPYHNSLHAADVVQGVAALLRLSSSSSTDVSHYISPIEVLGCLLAAIVHDMGHKGLNNNYEVATSSEIALMYNDRSVMENYHASRAFFLLRNKDLNFLCDLPPNDQLRIRKIVLNCILATDVGAHFDILGQFKSHVASKDKDGLASAEGRQLLLQMIIKVADMGNPGRKCPIYLKWAQNVMDEFYIQGDKEKERGLPVSSFMDRSNPQAKQCQTAFLDFLVLPMLNVWASVFPGSSFLLRNALDNREYWSLNDKIPPPP